MGLLQKKMDIAEDMRALMDSGSLVYVPLHTDYSG